MRPCNRHDSPSQHAADVIVVWSSRIWKNGTMLDTDLRPAQDRSQPISGKE